jgi:hypothetical protein
VSTLPTRSPEACLFSLVRPGGVSGQPLKAGACLPPPTLHMTLTACLPIPHHRPRGVSALPLHRWGRVVSTAPPPPQTMVLVVCLHAPFQRPIGVPSQTWGVFATPITMVHVACLPPTYHRPAGVGLPPHRSGCVCAPPLAGLGCVCAPPSQVWGVSALPTHRSGVCLHSLLTGLGRVCFPSPPAIVLGVCLLHPPPRHSPGGVSAPPPPP